MEKVINIEFFEHLGLLASLVIGLTVFRVVTCKPFNEDGEEWSWDKLLLGLFKHLIISLAVSLVYAVGSLWGTELIDIKIGATEMTIQSALDVILLTAISFFGLKFVRNFAQLMGIIDAVPEVTPIYPQTTFNDDPSVMIDSDEAQG